MEKNMGKSDKMIRLVLAVVFLAVGFSVSGWLMYLFLVMTIVMALTSAFGVCPLYVPLGINTLKNKEKRGKR